MRNPKKTLTEQDIAAIAAGAPSLEAQGKAEAEAAALAAAEATRSAAEIEAVAAAALAAAQATADAEAAAAGDKKDDVVADKPDDGIVAFLQSQIKEKDTALLDAAIAKKELEAKLASVDAVHKGLLAIACNSVGKMQVALGGAATDLSAAEPLAVLAEHDRVSKVFTERFKVGGVASTALQDKGDAKVEPAVSALTQAQLASVRIGKK